MKNTIGHVVLTIFVTFLLLLGISLINVFSTINKANAYHQTCIAELQASNFADISKYQGDHNGFHTTITNRTVKNDNENLEKTGRIYEVVTTYKVSIPFIGYSSTKTIQGYAR